MPKDERYGLIQTASVGSHIIPNDEPVFLLRAQDKLAPMVLRVYAEMRGLFGDEEACARIRKIAQDFEAWPKRKMPD